MSNRASPHIPLERSLTLAALALGLFHAWVGRYAMNRDGMSYLDVGSSFSRGDWANAVNAYWSPLYPWTVGLVLRIAKPSPKWEFPLVHLVNFGIFVATLFAFRFLLQALLAFESEPTPAANSRNCQPLPSWALILLAYAIFLWIALEVERLFEVTPDLAVLACVCLAAGMLLRLSGRDTLWKFALFGLILALGYWSKAVLFPLGFVILATSYWWRRSRPGWGRGMAVAALAFLCACAPLIFLLSHQKGRFTFGDSGKVNYAWLISPRSPSRNWQGQPPGSGTPAHSTRQLLLHPPLFEFDGPVVGTYPPWTDPSYWNEGLRGHFNLKSQLQVLAATVPSETRLLLRARPDLVAAIVVLALLSGQLWRATLRQLWPLIAMSIVGMAMYLPLAANDRYLGGFVLVLFLTLLAAVRLRPDFQTAAIYVVVAVFVTMMLGTLDYAVRVVTHHYAIPGSIPTSTVQDASAAEQLWRIGIQPRTKVAVVGDGTDAYWARLAKLRIVAEIMDTNSGAKEFWSAPEEAKQNVYQAFAQTHAELLVTSCPLDPSPIPSGWRRLDATPYCIRPLPPSP